MAMRAYVKEVHPVNLIEIARRRRGIRQADLASAARTSRNLIVKIEAGHIPSPGIQERIARVLGVEEAELWPGSVGDDS